MKNDRHSRQSSIPVEEIEQTEGIYRLFLSGDLVQALALAEQVLSRRPDDTLAATVFRLCEESSTRDHDE